MKKITSYILLIIFSTSAFAQEIIWEKFTGGTNNEVAHYLLYTDDGGFVTIGYTESYGTGEWGKPEMWLSKFDEDGEMLWNNTYGQPDSLDKAYFGIEIPDGYLLVGERMEDIVYGNGMCGIIVKTDFEGNEIWSKKYKGDNKDMLRHIQPVPENGYIACGATRSNGAGFIDGWAVKLDEECNIEWQSNFGGDNYEVFKQIYPTPDGGFLAGGFSNSDAGYGSYDIWFVKLDAQGNMEWEKRIGNEYSNRINYFVPTSDGNYISTGRSEQDDSGTDELFVLKVNPDCDVIWEQYYPATVEGEGHYIEESLSTGYIIAGADANSIGGPWQTDGWVLRINNVGDLLWDYFVHGDASDLFYVARQNEEGDIIAGGGNMSTGMGMNDLWLTKLSDSTYITSISNETSSNVFVYPNPTSGLLNIKLPSSKNSHTSLNVIDIFGKTLLKTKFHNNSESSATINLSDYKKGIYIIQLTSDGNTHTKQIVLQ